MSDASLRILVVDDELGMREGCRKILAAEGYEVATAENGQAGLELFLRQPDFAAAILDLKMPKMGGIELIERLRQQDTDIVLLVITAYATIDTAVEATKRGAYNYIPKPFTPDELLIPLRNGLERRALILESRRLREERDAHLLELAFEKSKLGTIINCMDDGVLVTNRDGQLVLRNAAAARVLRGCAQLVLPAPLHEINCQELETALRDALREGAGPVVRSMELPLRDETYLVSTSPVREAGAEALGAVAVLRDITALKRLETAKSMFVSMVAHEVKRPLAAIEGYLNLIVSGLAGHDPERDLNLLRRAQVRASTLRTLVSELMTLTAVETGKFALHRSATDFAEIIREAMAACQERADEKGLKLTFVTDDAAELTPVFADPGAILSAVTNLLDNAVKYTPERGHVNVRVFRDGVHMAVAIQDDGIGMTAEEKSKAFEEFYRASNRHTLNLPGTGLGLSLAKRLVDMHHGRIEVESAPDVGSTFTVYLPGLAASEPGTG